MQCPKCSSSLIKPDQNGDLHCICGNIIYRPVPVKQVPKVNKEVPKVEEPVNRPQSRGRQKGVRFSKTTKRIPEVIVEKELGKSIREIMKSTGLAKNTVRSIIKNPTPLEDYEPGCTKEEFFDILKKVSQTPKVEVDIRLVIDDLFKAELYKFTQSCKEDAAKWNAKLNIDSIMVQSTEYIINFPQTLNEIMPKIHSSSDTAFARGAIYAIARIRDLLLSIKNMEDKYDEDKKS
jgi:hypothetical protein